jgi:hypothetical protein
MYVILIVDDKFQLTMKEVEEIRDTPYYMRIEDAQQCKDIGNSFFERQMYKIALDRYITGIRRLKLDNKVRIIFMNIYFFVRFSSVH